MLTTQDLASVLQIVDLASSRGCFRGPELLAVGTMYEKIQAAVREEEGTSPPPQPEESTVKTVSGEVLQ